MRNVFKAVSVSAFVILIVSLIPFALIAPYATPIADDFGYGAPVFYALRAGGSFPAAEILRALAESLQYSYRNWQGTFGSVLLFSLQPAAFADKLYAVTPAVMLSAVIFPVFAALKSIRGMNRSARIFIGSIIALLCVQYLPSVSDGIFWWNGAAHYMIFWGLSVTAIILQINLSDPKNKGKTFFIKTAALCLLAFFIGGGNYSCALTFTLASCILTVFASAKRNKYITAAGIFITVFAAAGLLISAAAPGNAVRQAEFEKLNAVSAIIMSLRQAAVSVGGFTDIKIIGALMMCAPVFVISARKTDFKFRYPFLVCVISFLLLAAMYAPPLYATGDCTAMRMENMFYLAYLFFIFGNIFYISGWIARKASNADKSRRIMVSVCAVGAAVFTAACVFSVNDCSAYIAYSDLRSGGAETYGKEIEERIKIYNDKSITSARFEPISQRPASFFNYSSILTWSPDVIVNGIPVELVCYHACGGEVTFVEPEAAAKILCEGETFSASDFSKTIQIGGKECVPIRELCNLLGFEISYDSPRDTISIKTNGV